jgi:hypothetical protein
MAADVSQVVGCLAKKHNALSSNPRTVPPPPATKLSKNKFK